MKKILLAIALWLLPAFALAQAPNPVVSSRPFHLISAATDNSTLIKAGVHIVTSITAVNTTTTMYYLKFYDKATAPTCGSDTVQLTYPVPFGASNSGGGIVVPLPPPGIGFNNGLGICLVAGIADNDDTSAATGLAISIGYQ